MDERTPDEIMQEADELARAADAGLIDNPNLDPPDVAEVGLYG